MAYKKFNVVNALMLKLQFLINIHCTRDTMNWHTLADRSPKPTNKHLVYIELVNRLARTMFRAVSWVILPCRMIVDRRFRGAYCLHHQL
jgi:hypothetical protein